MASVVDENERPSTWLIKAPFLCKIEHGDSGKVKLRKKNLGHGATTKRKSTIGMNRLGRQVWSVTLIDVWHGLERKKSLPSI